jgi:hypothetical protein
MKQHPTDLAWLLQVTSPSFTFATMNSTPATISVDEPLLFTKFRKLPLEIRLMIWELLVSENCFSKAQSPILKYFPSFVL